MRRRDFLVQAILGGASCLATGCGTLFHKERINRPHSRDIDWKVVALNGLGLAFFFVPGVIAFIVDFHTGAIYLPPEYAASHSGVAGPEPVAAGTTEPTVANAQHDAASASTPDLVLLPQPSQGPSDGTVRLRKVATEGSALDRTELERRIGSYLGHPIQLDAPAVRVSPMKRLEDYATHRAQHGTDPSFGMSVRRFFRSLRTT